PAPPAPTAGDAAGTGAATLPPSKVAVIFLDTVMAKCAQEDAIEKVLEDVKGKLSDLSTQEAEVKGRMAQVGRDMANGIGDPDKSYDQHIQLENQLYKITTDEKHLTVQGQIQLQKMRLAMMVDIQSAVKQVAERENIDVVINRRDAEEAAVAQKKKQQTLLDKKEAEAKISAQEKAAAARQTEAEIEQQMLDKIQNTFPLADNAMDITQAVVKQMADDYAAQKFTNWQDMTLPDASSGGNGGGGGGGPDGRAQE
ncbi:MAG: hypothetical protein ACREJ2_11850, partial [Planctomycetota bacterium]